MKYDNLTEGTIAEKERVDTVVSDTSQITDCQCSLDESCEFSRQIEARLKSIKPFDFEEWTKEELCFGCGKCKEKKKKKCFIKHEMKRAVEACKKHYEGQIKGEL